MLLRGRGGKPLRQAQLPQLNVPKKIKRSNCVQKAIAETGSTWCLHRWASIQPYGWQREDRESGKERECDGKERNAKPDSRGTKVECNWQQNTERL